jgi:hypothetical protein
LASIHNLTVKARHAGLQKDGDSKKDLNRHNSNIKKRLFRKDFGKNSHTYFKNWRLQYIVEGF